MQDTDLIRLDFVISESWSRQLQFATPSKKSFSSRFGGKGAPGCRPVTRGRGGGEGPAGLKKIYYICFEKLFLRPCSNVKRISGTSNTVGHLITYKRSSSAQLNRILAVFVIIVHGLDEAALFI